MLMYILSYEINIPKYLEQRFPTCAPWCPKGTASLFQGHRGSSENENKYLQFIVVKKKIILRIKLLGTLDIFNTVFLIGIGID